MADYQVIYADPPWRFSQGINRRAQFKNKVEQELNLHYETMSNKEIAALPIGNLLQEDAAIFLWTTDAHLKEAIGIMEAWGFKYVTVAFVWSKQTTTGKQAAFMGKWTVKSCELCLFGTKGKMSKYLKTYKVRQLISEPRGKHSQKPDKVRESINAMFGDIKKLELFARKQSQGWDVWGNEVEGIDLQPSDSDTTLRPSKAQTKAHTSKGGLG